MQNHTFGTYGYHPIIFRSTITQKILVIHHAHPPHTLSHHLQPFPTIPFTAPILALHTLANAADQAAAEREGVVVSEEEREKQKRKRVTIDGNSIHLRVKKKKKPDPTPRNPFPDVVTKGLVSDAEARELWDL